VGIVGDREQALRVLLNGWDPIGIQPGLNGAPQDEYDCLLSPLLTRLERGDSAAAIAGFLRSELASHFGLDPDASGPDAFAAEMLTWYRQRAN
jgi:hypothetical protein